MIQFRKPYEKKNKEYWDGVTKKKEKGRKVAVPK